MSSSYANKIFYTEEIDKFDNLEDAMVYFRGQRNFYTTILYQFTRIQDSNLPTFAGVSITNGKMLFIYNEKLISSLKKEDLLFVIEHECLHIAQRHIVRYLRLISKSVKDVRESSTFILANIAADMATNSLLVESGLHDECAIVKRHRNNLKLKKIGHTNIIRVDQKVKSKEKEYIGDTLDLVFPECYDMEKGLSMEQYLVSLLEELQKENIKIEQKNGEYTVTFRNGSCIKTKGHEWTPDKEKPEDIDADYASSLADTMDKETKKALRKAIKQTKDPGSIPGYLNDIVAESLKEDKIPWSTLFEKMVKNSRNKKSVRSTHRPNRRVLGYYNSFSVPLLPFPGKGEDATYVVALSVDTSGSMYEKDIEQAISICKKMMHTDSLVKLHIISFDCEVHSIDVVTRGAPTPTITFTQGGTDFNKAFAVGKQLKPDLFICMTDGFANPPDSDNRPKCPILWLLTDYEGYSYIAPDKARKLVVKGEHEGKFLQ